MTQPTAAGNSAGESDTTDWQLQLSIQNYTLKDAKTLHEVEENCKLPNNNFFHIKCTQLIHCKMCKS